MVLVLPSLRHQYHRRHSTEQTSENHNPQQQQQEQQQQEQQQRRRVQEEDISYKHHRRRRLFDIFGFSLPDPKTTRGKTNVVYSSSSSRDFAVGNAPPSISNNNGDDGGGDARGYICTKGSPPWLHHQHHDHELNNADYVDNAAQDQLLQQLPPFTTAYHERSQYFTNLFATGLDNTSPSSSYKKNVRVKDLGFAPLRTSGVTNHGGNGLFHAFWIWTLVRVLRPTVVVESGVRNGYTSWLIRRAMEANLADADEPHDEHLLSSSSGDGSGRAAAKAVLYRFDPNERGWDGDRGVPPKEGGVTVVDFRGRNRFQDISSVDWRRSFKKYGLDLHTDKKRTLFVLDDHQDQLRRMAEIKKMGFKHVVVDDNYLPGVGDAFSMKDACDADGRLRGAFADYYDESDGGGGERVQRRRPHEKCDDYRQMCEVVDDEKSRQYAHEFNKLVETYWECPPLAPLDRPYGSIVEYIVAENGYQGPSTWTPRHSELVVESTKQPLLHTLEEAAAATGLSKEDISMESGRYLHMAYVKLR